eukprot:3417254-Ditylum_brightwellii.AAC.1
MIMINVKHYATLLCKQNVYLVNYADSQIGGVSDKMLHHDVSGKLGSAQLKPHKRSYPKQVKILKHCWHYFQKFSPWNFLMDLMHSLCPEGYPHM